MISPLHILALDSDVCPTSVPSPVAPLNTYTFLKGLVGPEGFGGVRRVWWGLKGLAGFEGFGGVGFRESSLLGFHHGFYGTQPVLGRTF